MKNGFLLGLTLLCSGSLIAQTYTKDRLPEEPCIYKQDGTLLLLSEGDYQVDERLLWDNYRYPDGEKVDFLEVRFLQTADEYYAVVPVQALLNTGYRFAERMMKGNVDVFRYTENVDASSRSISYYYAIGLEEPLPLTYNELKRDLVLQDQRPYRSRNERINTYLRKSKRRKTIRTAALIGGLATFVGGSIWYAQAEEPGGMTTTGQRNGLIVATAGILVAGIPLFTVNHKQPLLDAVELYNETY